MVRIHNVFHLSSALSGVVLRTLRHTLCGFTQFRQKNGFGPLALQEPCRTPQNQTGVRHTGLFLQIETTITVWNQQK